ncbi:MAG: hypothetical protein ACI4DL_06940 [Lachnospiraceae bacterium]
MVLLFLELLLALDFALLVLFVLLVLLVLLDFALLVLFVDLFVESS